MGNWPSLLVGGTPRCVCILTEDRGEPFKTFRRWIPSGLQVGGGSLPGPWKPLPDAEGCAQLNSLWKGTVWSLGLGADSCPLGAHPAALGRSYWEPFPGCALVHVP